METMRVALVSTPHVSVPPRGYGGTELVVAELAQALSARGVEVVVYATGDSELPGIEVRSYFSEAQWPIDEDLERIHAQWCLRDAARDPRGFDVIHLHCCAALEVAHLSPYPLVYTIHHALDLERSARYASAPQVKIVAVSENQARREKSRVDAVVHHGLEPSRFRQLPEQGYLLFLGRYDKEKGVEQAIEVAARANLPLVLAGRAHQEEYYRQVLKPLLARSNVLELGPVGGQQKVNLIARARALLFPIQWEEPFGLVMIEAMLCGVPVLATRRGSVSEVVEDGLTGILCDDPSEMVAAARIAEKFFDRDQIRSRAQHRWSAARMANDYLRVYRAAQLQRLTGRESFESAGA